jgi:TetR/AcrR family transcriptional regulator
MSSWKNLVPDRSAMRKLKREALVREAISAFNAKGFHATALEDIATRLGVTKAALYHYFPTKHALLYECFERALKVAFAALDHAQRTGSTGYQKLHLTIQGYLTVALDELNRCVILTEEHVLLPEHRDVIFRQRDDFERALRALVREGINDGSIVPCDPKLAIFSVWGAVNSVPKWFSSQGQWSSDQLAQAMADMVCRALARHPSDTLATDVAGVKPQATGFNYQADDGPSLS